MRKEYFIFVIIIFTILLSMFVKSGIYLLDNSSTEIIVLRQRYQNLTTEEKNVVKQCLVEQLGQTKIVQAIEYWKSNRTLDQMTIDTLKFCIETIGDFNVSKYTGMYVTELVKPALRNPQMGSARCNDGTPFAFRIEKPTLSKSNVWVIYLQGGGFCDDNANSCKERVNEWPALITTLKGNDGQKYLLIGNKGIFNHDPTVNPIFYNANKVYAHYCSSDIWSGSTSELKQTTAGQWYFSGKINVQVMLEVLKEQYGLNDSNETKILFTGGSAGCFGTDANAEQISKLFPNTAKAGRLKIISDGCFAPDFDDPNYRLGNSGESIRNVVIKAFDFLGSSINSLCEQDQKIKGNHPGNCFMGSVIYPYLTQCGNKGLCLPNLIQYSSIDYSFVTNHGIDPKASPTNIGLEKWRNQTLKELSNPEIKWLFSGGDRSYHTLTLKDEMWTYGPSGGPTYGELVNEFWNNRQPRRVIFGNPTPVKSSDLNSDGKVDVIDLGILLSSWGRVDKPPSDLNQDGKVDVIDLGILLSNWGK